MNTKVRSVPRVALLCILCAIIGAVLLVARPAEAQRSSHWPELLPPIDAHQARLLEADYTADKLGLDEEGAKKLSKAYIAAHTSYDKAMLKAYKELHSPEGDHAARRAAFREAYPRITAAEQGAFKEALLAFLSKEQATETFKLLGTFSAQMDLMFYLVSGYNLGDRQSEALDLVADFILADEKLHSEASAEEGRSDERREKSRLLKEKLDKSLGAMLSEAQMLRWTESTTPERERERRGQRGGGERRRSSGSASSGEQGEAREPASSGEQGQAREPESSGEQQKAEEPASSGEEE